MVSKLEEERVKVIWWYCTMGRKTPGTSTEKLEKTLISCCEFSSLLSSSFSFLTSIPEHLANFHYAQSPSSSISPNLFFRVRSSLFIL